MLTKLIYCVLILAFAALPAAADRGAERQKYHVYVDPQGVMRRSDTDAEVSYYGTNYTAPFAHAYRALGYLGRDRKEAIRNDVQHMARLGLNAFRLHLWEAEIADSAGNLLENDHLDLLDYLIAQLEDRGIDIVLTAQTNFGNGYPEKNIDTGAFTYDFEKCSIHEDPRAQEAQERYLRQLARHENPYTGRTYAADNAIIALEINNEPCHSGSERQVQAYIDRMAKALREEGVEKPILYNVTHNPDVTAAYYRADVDGTTYQWYPTGLVAGRTRKGNFLPVVDSYQIPWTDLPGFGSKARVVYEFDPADVLYSHLYPATAKAFRQAGFQWITQFAYDPTDLAPYNTEYQTHFLNLGYTPGKALSMMIAAEAARQLPRGGDFGQYPADTVFGNFRVSHREDLSELNDGRQFLHSNTTATAPSNPGALERVAGVGSSPVVNYPGSGAYFLDRVAPGVWRLEVWPDVMLTSDPFRKTSLKRQVGEVVYAAHPIDIYLPDLGETFTFRQLGADGAVLNAGKAREGGFTVSPGVWLLGADPQAPEFTNLPATVGGVGLTEFTAPKQNAAEQTVVHEPKAYALRGKPLEVEATVFGTVAPDSVLIYPGTVSFWREDNPLYCMTQTGPYTYRAELPTASDSETADYNIVTFKDGRATTWPQGIEGTPLDWDFIAEGAYSTALREPADQLTLIKPEKNLKDMDTGLIPDNYSAHLRYRSGNLPDPDAYIAAARTEGDSKLVVRRYVGSETSVAPGAAGKKRLGAQVKAPRGAEVEIGVTDRDGFRWSRTVTPDKQGIVEVELQELRPAPVLTVPAQFPTMLPRELQIFGEKQPGGDEIDFVDIVFHLKGAAAQEAEVAGAWLK